MIKKIFLIGLLSIFLHSLTAQQYYEYGNTPTLSYFGERFWHPGARIGYEMPVFSNEIVRPRKTSHILMFHPGLGYYKHKYSHSALFLNSEIGYNMLFFFGLEFRINLGVGYLRTFLDGDTYKLSNDGSFEKVPLAGNNTFMPSISLHLGYDFSRLTNSALAFFIKPSLFLQVPYNDFVLPQYAVEVGFKYHLNKKKEEDSDEIF
jgi:hypothetical protein